MNTKTNKFLFYLIVCALLLANTALSLADDELEEVEVKVETITEDFEEVVGENEEASEEEEEPSDAEKKQQEFIKKLQDELNISKADYKQVLATVGATKNRLKNLHEEKLDLQQQLQNIDDQILFSQEALINVIKEIVEKENEIRLLYDQMDVKKTAIEQQKEMLKDYLRLIYEQEKELFSRDENGEIDAFKFLLSDQSVGDNLKKIKYFDLLNEAGVQMVEKLDLLNRELKESEVQARREKERLSELEEQLAQEKANLELQKESKENLLKLTSGQERIYQELIAQSVEEQELLLSDLKSLSNAISFMERKIQEEGDSFDPEQYKSILDDRTRALYEFRMEAGSFDEFIWPVAPLRGISAYFHDPSYVGVFGVHHNAIDIPTYQSTPIRAAADGVVYTVRDNGFGYSYLILAHADGFMSVYGHVSDFLVEEGESVAAGTIVALSGGMPGTKGAGYMTTGPHLHFEVLLNGSYVDPLDYLNLAELTEGQIANLPEKYRDDWEADVLDQDFRLVQRKKE